MVVEATKVGEEERREIMMHLRECLAEPQGKRWRRMYAALVLTEELLKSGAPELFVETAEGRYFDLVQRLSLLEHFECTSDMRVQNMVRTKATALRAEVVPRLETASEQGVKGSSPHAISDTSSSTTASSSYSGGGGYSGGPVYLPKQEHQLVLNGVVTVGHNDDTDSDSGDDGCARKAVAYRKAKQQPIFHSSGGKPPPPPEEKSSGQAPAPSPTADLLDL